MADDRPSLVTTSVTDNLAAKALLRNAYEKTSRWGVNFPGFVSNLALNDNGKEYKGTVSIKSPKESEVNLEIGPAEEALLNWAKNQIGMMAIHRASRPFEESDGKYAITFADEVESHPLGRQICIHGDGLNSRYRIKDDRIRQVSRDMGRMRFTINIEDAMQTRDGKFLTTQYVVYYFSPQGQLTQVESFTDRPVRLDNVYLPGMRRVISVEGGDVIVRTLEFKNHRWMDQTL